MPLIVVSPYARPHTVSHRVYDHTSITRFVEARFLLSAMTRRDANAAPPFEMFDFKRPARLTAPLLPAAPLEARQQVLCDQNFPVKPKPDGGI